MAHSTTPRLLRLLTASIFAAAAPTLFAVGAAASRPNILWITVEDMSANLGCYGDDYATTPHIDGFAKSAVRYTGAFATAPVCSPARSCLITGVYATSLGTQRLRSEFPIPENVRGFPELLRRAGYFTTNNSKTDYNVRDEAAFIARTWDECGTEAHFRHRIPGQPFFSVFNSMTTHQTRTSVWPEEEFEAEVASHLSKAERHDPEKAPLPPYYPDTPTVRRTVARYYDCITAMDKEVGTLLAELEADGLAEDTIVFFFSDHGMGLPRGKRVLHDSGLHVPLLVRFPKKYASFAPVAPGGTSERLVSFVDFGPTVLSLAGIATPEWMEGLAFLGPNAAPPRKYVFGARDRVDEVFDLARSVRDGRYLYIRNYRPHLSWMPPERFSDHAEMRCEMKRLLAEGQLDALQMTYAAPERPLEELYDSEKDPHQVKNLASSAEHAPILDELRSAHETWVFETRDLGFLTEPDAWKRSGSDAPRTMAREPKRYPLKRILAAAKLVGREDRVAIAKEIELLGDSDPAVRHHAALGLHAAGDAARSARPALRRALEDESVSVRIEAAAALAARGDPDPALESLTAALELDEPEVVLAAMRSLELLGDGARSVRHAIERTLERARTLEASSTHPCWMFVRFSAEAWLEANPAPASVRGKP